MQAMQDKVNPFYSTGLQLRHQVTPDPIQFSSISTTVSMGHSLQPVMGRQSQRHPQHLHWACTADAPALWNWVGLSYNLSTQELDWIDKTMTANTIIQDNIVLIGSLQINMITILCFLLFTSRHTPDIMQHLLWTDPMTLNITLDYSPCFTCFSVDATW